MTILQNDHDHDQCSEVARVMNFHPNIVLICAHLMPIFLLKSARLFSNMGLKNSEHCMTMTHYCLLTTTMTMTQSQSRKKMSKKFSPKMYQCIQFADEVPILDKARSPAGTLAGCKLLCIDAFLKCSL